MVHKSTREAMLQSDDLKVRLPADLRQWVAEEALRNRSSMNAVIIKAVDHLKTTRTARLADNNHAAAIELAIAVAQLPKGSAIILQTEHHHLSTDILVREPSHTDCSILARVQGEEVVFADDSAEVVRSEDGQ
jgi:hypothetical protein